MNPSTSLQAGAGSACARGALQALLHRLSLAQKFAILGAVGLLMAAVPTVLYL